MESRKILKNVMIAITSLKMDALLSVKSNRTGHALSKMALRIAIGAEMDLDSK